MSDDSHWDDLDGFEEYHQPFMVPSLSEEQRAEAIAAVNEAMANYVPPTRLQRLRSTLWLAQYMVKLWFAVRWVRFYCWASKKDSRLVSQKVWRMLNL